jgi:hypothetical protein
LLKEIFLMILFLLLCSELTLDDNATGSNQ